MALTQIARRRMVKTEFRRIRNPIVELLCSVAWAVTVASSNFGSLRRQKGRELLLTRRWMNLTGILGAGRGFLACWGIDDGTIDVF
jgi:hypothetical protein